uniref:Olfactory receptor 1151 n=1 Tax=Jaculus jaculus TaxID=51337 RepID=A0A8C5KZ30_JACJA
VNELIFLGITNNPEMIVPFFTMFLIIYLLNLLANLGMLTLIRVDSQLHTVIYFFLSHISLCNLCYSTVAGPKMLFDLLAEDKSVSIAGCALQFLTFCVFADSECVLLAVMAFDQYQAISSKPLLYTVNMSSTVYALIHTTLAFQLCFYVSNGINHFFCGLPPLYLLSCSEIKVNDLALFSILSAKGRVKAFSTCASHLTAVAIFQGAVLFMYFRPSSSYSLDQDKISSLFYTPKKIKIKM